MARARNARGNNGLSAMAGVLAEFNAALNSRGDFHPSRLGLTPLKGLLVSIIPLHTAFNFISATNGKIGGANWFKLHRLLSMLNAFFSQLDVCPFDHGVLMCFKGNSKVH